jgi:hypothetical protein
MSTTLCPSPIRVAAWQKLYQNALLETDQSEVTARIAEAERAILRRTRELYDSSADNIEEDQALDDALYTLQALHNSQAREKQAA